MTKNLKFIEGDYRLEAELHRRFADLRIKGEWFRFAEPLASFIDRATQSAVEREIVL